MELEPATNGNTGAPGAQLDSDQYQELVRLLYGALQVSSCHYAGQDSVSVIKTLYNCCMVHSKSVLATMLVKTR